MSQCNGTDEAVLTFDKDRRVRPLTSEPTALDADLVLRHIESVGSDSSEAERVTRWNLAHPAANLRSGGAAIRGQRCVALCNLHRGHQYA